MLRSSIFLDKCPQKDTGISVSVQCEGVLGLDLEMNVMDWLSAGYGKRLTKLFSAIYNLCDFEQVTSLDSLLFQRK